ncbi:MAG: DUF4376 domain-containing protein [Acidovorax sp.]|nr:DUF4376 domain-containing protein [Acidovorax sp.]
MKYLHIATYVVEELAAIRVAYPNMSIPDGADLSDMGFAPLREVAPPEAPPGSRVTLAQPALVEGEWLTQWAIVPIEGEELEAMRTAKNAEIKAARLAANRSTFTHAGKQIACDDLSRSDIDGTNGYITLYNALPPGWPGGWKAVDNTFVPIATVADWKAFYTSMFAAGNANFAKAQALKAQLAAATDGAGVAGVAW